VSGYPAGKKKNIVLQKRLKGWDKEEENGFVMIED
jgi:hypothetical protein